VVEGEQRGSTREQRGSMGERRGQRPNGLYRVSKAAAPYIYIYIALVSGDCTLIAKVLLCVDVKRALTRQVTCQLPERAIR
jgi:hypothetical protein